MTKKNERKTLHFDLSNGHQDVEYTLEAGLKKYPLKKHSSATLEKAKAYNTALKLLPEDRITHFVEDVELPVDTAQLLLITTPSVVQGTKLDTLMLSCIHVPTQAREINLRKKLKEKHYTTTMPHPKFLLHGINVTLNNLQPVIDVHDWKTARDAAVSLIFHHGELLNVEAETAAKITHIIEYSNGINDLAFNIYQQAMDHKHDPGKNNWVVEKPFLHPDGTPVKDKKQYVWTERTKEWMVGPMIDSLKQAKDDPDLESTASNVGCYTIQNGITSIKSKQNPPKSDKDISDEKCYWSLVDHTPHHGFVNVGGIKMEDGVFSTGFDNQYLRWLSIFVEFLGPDYKTVIKPSEWESPLSDKLAGAYDTDRIKYVELIPSVNTILGINVGSSPKEVKFTWPQNASGVKILAGGLGRTGGIKEADGYYYGGWDAQVCTPGTIMTAVFNLGLPAICLLHAALISLSSLNSLAQSACLAVLDLARILIKGTLALAIAKGDTKDILKIIADCLLPLILDIPVIALWVSSEIAEGAAEQATPFIGWLASAVAITTDISILSQTSAQVASSPAKFELLATRAMDVSWTLLPDKNHQNTWPREATHHRVIATYKDGTSMDTTGTMNFPKTGPITVKFKKIPAGGEIMFSANFYSDTDWLCGRAQTAFLKAEPDSENTMIVPEMNIKEKIIPLTPNTRYQFNNKLIYNSNQRKHKWSNTSGSPIATIKDLDSSNIGHNLSRLVNITLNQDTSQLGYCWQASGQNIPLTDEKAIDTGQMFTFQTIDNRDEPQSALRFVPKGFELQPLLFYNLKGAGDDRDFNFYIDSRNGGYHLRQIILDGSTKPFDLDTEKSWGRFSQQIDACIVHPSGRVVGISTKNNKIEVLKLGKQSYADKDAPLADLYSGYGSRPGNLHLPIAIAVTSDSGILILEDADPNLKDAVGRIQAFDLLGNPANIFNNSNSPFMVLKKEDQPVTYLDLDVESKGFIYVLKYIGDGSRVADYLLDIYNPDGSFLCQTSGVSSAKIKVDLWRTLFTLNFEIIEKSQNGRSEPSVSIWLPSTP